MGLKKKEGKKRAGMEGKEEEEKGRKRGMEGEKNVIYIYMKF